MAVNVKVAAEKTKAFIDRSYTPDKDEEVGKDHLYWMCTQITAGFVDGEKAHRWLGYIQGVLVYTQAATIEDFRKINKDEE